MVKEREPVVLLVEDQDTVRGLVRQVLTRAGYDVAEASDGREGQRAFEACERVDLIVTDVVMPHMSGPEFVAQIREHHPGVPVLFISGYASDEVLPRLDGDPTTDFLAKPFSLEDLRARVTALLGPESER